VDGVRDPVMTDDALASAEEAGMTDDALLSEEGRAA
jgi:hypothetical protein